MQIKTLMMHNICNGNSARQISFSLNSNLSRNIKITRQKYSKKTENITFKSLLDIPEYIYQQHLSLNATFFVIKKIEYLRDMRKLCVVNS